MTCPPRNGFSRETGDVKALLSEYSRRVDAIAASPADYSVDEAREMLTEYSRQALGRFCETIGHVIFSSEHSS